MSLYPVQNGIFKVNKIEDFFDDPAEPAITNSMLEVLFVVRSYQLQKAKLNDKLCHNRILGFLEDSITTGQLTLRPRLKNNR